ncbi:hypothetical protein C8Q75DRAFT_749965 [Abortiporus biennis]|nr:hypothetical protein C8Q75DRAFT_749965 [Abortiporus biennis]
MSMPTVLHDSGISGSGRTSMTNPTSQQSTTGEALVPEPQCNDPSSQTTGTRKRRKSSSQNQVAQTSQLTANIASYPSSLTNQGKQIDPVDADNEEYLGSMSAPGPSKRPRFATYAFTTSPPPSAAVLTLPPVDPVRLPSSPSHPQEDLIEPLSTGEYGANADFQSLGDESMQNESTHVDFEMLDLADVTALPWVDDNPDFSSDLHAHSSLYMQQASIFVPAGLGVMLQNMKHELEMEIMARQRAERWFLDELQRRVEAERSLASLREEGH